MYLAKMPRIRGAIHLTVMNAMGMARIQCQNHDSHETKGACRCVTVNVIMPVAMTAVNNCVRAVSMIYLRKRAIISQNADAATKPNMTPRITLAASGMNGSI